MADKYKAFYMMTVAWADWIEKDKYQWSADYFFTPAIAAAVPFEMVKTMPKSEVPQKWGMFTEDNADGQGLAGGRRGDRQGERLHVGLHGRGHAGLEGLLVLDPQAEGRRGRRALRVL